MSSKETSMTREEVMAAREAKKLAKQKGKTDKTTKEPLPTQDQATVDNKPKAAEKGKDEVDKAIIVTENVEITDKSKEQIKAERAAKKQAKQAKKKGLTDTEMEKTEKSLEVTNKTVADTISNIVDIAKEVQEITAKPEEVGRSKSELKAERRAKQEAQRAAKRAQAQAKTEAKPVAVAKTAVVKEKAEVKAKPKDKAKLEKSKSLAAFAHRVPWFQHLYSEQSKNPLDDVPLNSNLHPAIIKLGVQLASRVITGSNARCIALLDALKKMVSDYTLPAKTEFARGLEAHLAASLAHVWRARPPCAAQANAVKAFRHQLTQLPHNVDEFDAKKTLQEEIDRYIREQIDMAGEAISLTVRNKISNGDKILTYGCSSLICRILTEAHSAGVEFSVVAIGTRIDGGGRQMARRLAKHGVPVSYADVTALNYVMPEIDKVLLGASALLANGSVLGALGTAQTALVAREHNVPALVACETHKFSERVMTDAFVSNELGNPDDLIDQTDENSPLKDWRSNPNLTPLNLTYDVTPASLITAVVTELAILPCTSAPVVLRFKLSEYGI